MTAEATEAELLPVTSPLPGRDALVAAVGNRLRELGQELHELVERHESSWAHVDAVRSELSSLITSIDRGKQMFSWLDDLTGGGSIAERVRREIDA